MRNSRFLLHTILLLGLITTLLAGSGLFPAQAQTPSATPAPTTPPVEGETWTAPVNLSRSGAASQPRIVSSLDGRLQAFWMDRFDGMTYSVFDGSSWASPIQALRPPAQFSLTPAKITVMPFMLVDENNMIHSFWYSQPEQQASEQSLLYSQALFGTQLWKLGTTVAELALVFSVQPTGSRSMQLAYIRTLKTLLAAPGLYIRNAISGPSTGGLVVWQNPRVITSSIYYRVLTPEEALIQTAVVESAHFMIWREPRLDQILYSESVDGGITWSEPVPLGSLQTRIENPLLTTLPSGEVLRIWQDGSESGCSLYQQSMQVSPIDAQSLTPTPRILPAGSAAVSTPSVTLGQWSEPFSIHPGLETCPTSSRFFTLDETAYWLWGEDFTALNLSVWDPDRREWSIPQVFSFSFEDPETGWPVQLDNLHAAFTGDRMAVIGSDPGSGEVWVTESRISTMELMFAQTLTVEQLNLNI